MLKKIFGSVLALILTLSIYSQNVAPVFKCTDDTYKLLKQISSSVASKGEILLSITTHQDLGWVDEVEKCVIMRDTLWLTPYLNRLKEDKAFKMDIEQTSIITEYLNRHPDRKAEIQKGIDDGRILIGATYTQPYEELFTGESLIRQLYLGKKWLSDNFNGYKSDTYYNSDVPGRTLQMSQILAKSGVKNMFVSRHEKGVFNWYSPDSSKVTMFSSGHYIDFYNILGKESEPGVKQMAEEVLFWSSYFDSKSKKVVIPALLNYEFIWDQKPVRNCDPFMALWNSIKVIENEKGERSKVTLPPLRYGNLNNCLNAIRENSSKIKSISGERPAVWLYIHGPSHHFAISASRRADILLPDAEKFSAINSLLEGNFRSYNTGLLKDAWEAKIYPDHGWGGKGGEITDRLFLSKFVKASEDGEYLLSGALNRISSKIDFRSSAVPLVVFNGLNWKRSDPVKFAMAFNMGEAYGIVINDHENRKIECQLEDVEKYDDGSVKTASAVFIAADVPSAGYKTYYISLIKEYADKVNSSFIPDFENSYFAIRFGNGGIERLYDKTLGKEIIDPSKFKLGEVFTMQSVGNGAGEFSDIQQPTMEGFDKTGYYETKWQKICDGPVFASFKYRQPVKYAVVEETIIIYNQVKRIDFEIDVRNWQGVLYREFRAAFPLNITAPVITYEVPAGVVEVGKDELKGAAGHMYTTECRLVHPRTMVDWVNASGNGFGATISSSVIAFDYLDPTPDPSPATLITPILFASRKSCHWEGNDYIQLGDHHFSFSLFINEPGWKNGFREGKQGKNNPYTVLDPVLGAKTPLPESLSFIETKGDYLYLSAFKKSENDNSITMRLTDFSGGDQEAQIDLFMPFTKLYRTSLIEEDDTATGLSGKSFRLKIGKKTIETFKLK